MIQTRSRPLTWPQTWSGPLQYDGIGAVTEAPSPVRRDEGAIVLFGGFLERFAKEASLD